MLSCLELVGETLGAIQLGSDQSQALWVAQSSEIIGMSVAGYREPTANLSHSARKVAPYRRPMSTSIVGDQHLARPALAGVAEGEPGAGCRQFRFSFANGF